MAPLGPVQYFLGVHAFLAFLLIDRLPLFSSVVCYLALGAKKYVHAGMHYNAR